MDNTQVCSLKAPLWGLGLGEIQLPYSCLYTEGCVPWAHCSCNEVAKASARTNGYFIKITKQTNKMFPLETNLKSFAKVPKSNILVYFSYQEWGLLKLTNCFLLFVCSTLLLLSVTVLPVTGNSCPVSSCYQCGSLQKAASACSNMNV